MAAAVVVLVESRFQWEAAELGRVVGFAEFFAISCLSLGIGVVAFRIRCSVEALGEEAQLGSMKVDLIELFLERKLSISV